MGRRFKNWARTFFFSSFFFWSTRSRLNQKKKKKEKKNEKKNEKKEKEKPTETNKQDNIIKFKTL